MSKMPQPHTDDPPHKHHVPKDLDHAEAKGLPHSDRAQSESAPLQDQQPTDQ